MSINVSVRSGGDRLFSKFEFLVDGRSSKLGSETDSRQINALSATLHASELATGTHTMRVIALAAGAVRHQAFTERKFIVRNPGKGK